MTVATRRSSRLRRSGAWSRFSRSISREDYQVGGIHSSHHHGPSVVYPSDAYFRHSGFCAVHAQDAVGRQDRMIAEATLCLALVAYYEARGEPRVGELAVAHVA